MAMGLWRRDACPRVFLDLAVVVVASPSIQHPVPGLARPGNPPAARCNAGGRVRAFVLRIEPLRVSTLRASIPLGAARRGRRRWRRATPARTRRDGQRSADFGRARPETCGNIPFNPGALAAPERIVVATRNAQGMKLRLAQGGHAGPRPSRLARPRRRGSQSWPAGAPETRPGENGTPES
jgi:hypothetical protein